MFHVTVLPVRDPVFVSDHCALFVSDADVEAPVSEILAVADLEIAVLDGSLLIEQADRTTTGRNRVTAAI